MNKKSNFSGTPRSYARILDSVAGDQVPQQLDLAPIIMDRIQQRKGNHRMQNRNRLFSAAALAVIVLVVLIYTVPGIAAALGRWFGYVPGVGLVREGQIRVLANPVSVTRDGITVTVDQVILDPERTALVLSVEGIPTSAITRGIEGKYCQYTVSLRLPDGAPGEKQIFATPNGIQSWSSGYQHRFDFAVLPAAVNDVTLGIPCLYMTTPGAVPENWEIPLHFVPAPAQVTAFPVIEIPTATASPTLSAAPSAAPSAEPSSPAGSTPTASASPVAAASPGAAASPQPAALTLTFDRAVQMDDGYLIYASVNWKETPFQLVEVTDVTERLHLLDANGQPMLYEMRDDEHSGANVDQRQTVFILKTAPVQAPGPLTLVLDAVSVSLPAQASFQFDPGSDPQPGQTILINQDIQLGAYTLRIRNATVEPGSYSFEMSSDNGIVNASLIDLDHPIASGGGGGGGSGVNTFFSGFNYANGLPKGPITVTIGSIEVKHNQRLEAQWTPPAASITRLPTQPAACLTSASWAAASWAAAAREAGKQKPVLPQGITGRVLSAGIIDPDTSQWGVTLTHMSDLTQQVIKDATDGAISPDGKRLAYTTLHDGIAIMDLATGQSTPLPGSANGDFNPFWTPDSTQFVFMRGMGIFDLFMVRPDGTDLRQLTHGGVQEWPAGWLPDGRLLYAVPGREYESITYSLNLQSGASEKYPTDNIQAIAPSSPNVIVIEPTFGDRWLTYVSDPDGSNRWLLAEASLWVLSPTWSPDSQWLLAEVSATDSGSTTGALIDLRTCQVIALPMIKGNLLGWVK
jgi:hypothetical protein